MKGQKDIQVQEAKTLEALLATDLVPDRSCALDGGAHVGGWTVIMAAAFDHVISVEPSEAIDHLRENCAGLSNVEIINAALMDEPGRVDCFAAKRQTLTARQVRKSKKGAVRCLDIDSLSIESLGLLKLDIEGSELLALRGAVDTISRCRPYILCEMAGNGRSRGISDRDVMAFIISQGYRRTFLDNVDYGFSPL